MLYFTPKNATELFGGNEGRQALDYITRQSYGNREYLVDGEWLSEPTGKITGQRYNFGEDGKLLEDVWIIGEMWKYVKRLSIEQPEKPDKILEQMIDAKLQPQPLRLFSPWGPRYKKSSPKIEESDPEIATLKEMFMVLYQFKAVGYAPGLLLMPADVYGTEINDLPEQFVRDYFRWLEEAALRRLDSVADITVKPWSEIRNENRELYNMWCSLARMDFNDLVKTGELEKAVRVAQNFNPSSAEGSARKYCMERLVEAALIADLYDPIKLSLVRKEKDALDGPLKRIYIIKNRAPWMEGE